MPQHNAMSALLVTNKRAGVRTSHMTRGTAQTDHVRMRTESKRNDRYKMSTSDRLRSPDARRRQRVVVRLSGVRSSYRYGPCDSGCGAAGCEMMVEWSKMMVTRRGATAQRACALRAEHAISGSGMEQSRVGSSGAVRHDVPLYTLWSYVDMRATASKHMAY